MAEESSRPRVDTRFDFGETFKGKDGEVYRNRPAFRLNAKPENPTLRRLANKEPNRKIGTVTLDANHPSEESFRAQWIAICE